MAYLPTRKEVLNDARKLTEKSLDTLKDIRRSLELAEKSDLDERELVELREIVRLAEEQTYQTQADYMAFEGLMTAEGPRSDVPDASTMWDDASNVIQLQADSFGTMDHGR